MKRVLSVCFVLLLIATNGYCSNWRAGTGEDSVVGTTSIKNLDAAIFDYIVNPLDRLLAGYRSGCRLVYDAAAQFTVSAGEVFVSNAAGSIRLTLRNTTDTTVTWADIDAGAEATSTIYYVYGGTSVASDTTLSFTISTSATAPTGMTYFFKLGSFYNDGSGNITLIQNDNGIAGITIHTGTITGGSTIPLPNGYTEDQCSWMVSINDSGASTLGIIDGGSSQYIEIECKASGTRTVTCRGKNANSGVWTNMTANYMIIGIK